MNFLYELTDVNAQLNKEITYVSDDTNYNTPEWWEDAKIHNNLGDCEDYSLAKLHELLRRGWPIEKLRLTFCWVDKEGPENGHCVLVAECENRLWVLDNRYNDLREVSECIDYVWNTTQEIGGSRKWIACSKVFSKFYTSPLPPE